MKMSKFIIIGVLSLSVLVGCGSTAASNEVQTSSPTETASATATATAEATTEASPEVAEVTASPSPAAEVASAEPAEDFNQTVQMLGGLLGQVEETVSSSLGEAVDQTYLEQTKILVANYYKTTLLGKEATIEVDFNDNEKKANYLAVIWKNVSDLDTTVETYANTLTELFGESTVEKLVTIDAKKRREWQDTNKVLYALNYYEDRIELDIYPAE